MGVEREEKREGTAALVKEQERNMALFRRITAGHTHILRDRGALVDNDLVDLAILAEELVSADNLVLFGRGKSNSWVGWWAAVHMYAHFG